jgi:hypothetical protein
MKKTLYCILFLIGPFVLFYLMGVFITYTWNIVRWDEDGRAIYMILSVIASVLATGAFFEHYED